ncbi:MAG: hypothetical protein H6Q53_1753 [Deltaproteobacteria bacterium]|nr:hypothetical protein [Deltaproteobacteria bacterium]
MATKSKPAAKAAAKPAAKAAAKPAKKPAPKAKPAAKAAAKPAAKAAAKPAKKAAVPKGSKYTCGVCGMAVTVDTACGCAEAHPLVCCGKQMKVKKA